MVVCCLRVGHLCTVSRYLGFKPCYQLPEIITSDKAQATANNVTFDQLPFVALNHSPYFLCCHVYFSAGYNGVSQIEIQILEQILYLPLVIVLLVCFQNLWHCENLARVASTISIVGRPGHQESGHFT